MNAWRPSNYRLCSEEDSYKALIPAWGGVWLASDVKPMTLKPNIYLSRNVGWICLLSSIAFVLLKHQLTPVSGAWGCCYFRLRGFYWDSAGQKLHGCLYIKQTLRPHTVQHSFWSLNIFDMYSWFIGPVKAQHSLTWAFAGRWFYHWLVQICSVHGSKYVKHTFLNICRLLSILYSVSFMPLVPIVSTMI